VIRYLLLGLVQGLAEFLPISSSGHLVLAQRVLGIDPPGVLLEAVLHLATLVPVVWLLRKDVVRLLGSLTARGDRDARQRLALLVLGTLPVVAAGLLAEDLLEQAFASLLVVGVALLTTGALLLLASWAGRRAVRRRLSLVDAAAVGLAQAAALVPGLSRSGATIAAGLLRGVRGGEAARFSLLLSIPAVLGAASLKLVRVAEAGPATLSREAWGGLLVASLVAGIVGVFALKALLSIATRGRLAPFGVYCLAIGTATVLLSRAG
jgi:undecaprenyl-diphosphatase